MIEMKVVEGRLTDGSTVYNAHIRQTFDFEPDGSRCDGNSEEQVIIIPANTAGYANRIVDDLVRFVNLFTVEVAERTD